MATLAQIKSKLGISQLELTTANDSTGAPTQWLRHWDNDNRVAVSIHKDLAKELKSNPSITSLAVQTEQKNGEQGPYIAHRIIKYNSTPEVIL